MTPTLRAPSSKVIVEIVDAIDAVIICQSIRSCDEIPLGETLVEFDQHCVVGSSATRNPEADSTSGALLLRKVGVGRENLSRCATRNNRCRNKFASSVLFPYVAVVAIEVKLAQQQIDIDTAHKVHIEDQVVTQITLDAEVHVIAALYRIIFGIELRPRLVQFDVTNSKVVEVFRR